MSDLLVTGRRNFLVRALGFTAAGATLAVPVLAVSTPEERIRHHLKGLEQAFADHYGVAVQARFNEMAPGTLASNPFSAAYASVRAGPFRLPEVPTPAQF